jgi:hypothetical protein
MNQPTNKEIVKFVKNSFTLIWERKISRLILLDDRYILQWGLGGLTQVVNTHFGTKHSLDTLYPIIKKWYLSLK